VAEKQSSEGLAQVEDQFVSAILITHDGATWLSEVVAALSSQKHPVDQIIAVDTGSKDNSIKLLSNSGIEVINKPRSTGFGAAVSAAVTKLPKDNLKDGEQEWLWILHDDCAPDRYALAKLLEAVASRPQVGIAGPKILGWYDRKHILEVGISITENGSRWTGLEDREYDQGQHNDVATVLAVSTAGMLIKRSLFEELGGFDPSLELFRDDIDLGWRAHIAGHSVICVGEAIIYHAEASSSERRSIDVKDAILHRPLLLDRRNAAFVLLANSSWWILPWVAIQLLVTSLGRSFIYLLAKLPGYAADEIAAIGLLIFKPSDLIKSRRYRKRNRVLTPRVIKPFIPLRGAQVRAIIERVSSSILNAFKPGKVDQPIKKVNSYSEIGVIDESFDEIDSITTQRFSKIKALIKQPLLFGVLITFTISVFYSRNRFGSLSGGALAVAPDSAIQLITSYVDSWHLVGLGSSNPAPVWQPIIGILSLITAGNPQIFLALLMFLTPLILFILVYKTARSYALTNYSSVFVAFLYAFSPVVLTSINQGRLGTIAVAIFLPILFQLLIKNKLVANLTWRRTYLIALVAGLASAFSELFLLGWIVIHIIFILNYYLSSTNLGTYKWKETIKRFTLLITPFLMNLPTSLSLITHPITALREPGLSLASGDPLSVLMFNPGGLTSPPLIIFAPFLIYLLVSLASIDQRKPAIIALLTLLFAITLSSYYIEGNSSEAQRVWSGSLIVFAQLLLLLSVFEVGERLIPQLRRSNFGLRHIASVLTTFITIYSIIAVTLWATTIGANSLLKTDQEQVVPAFISDLANTNEKPKTLVIRKNEEQLQYFITRGGDLQLGNADIAIKTPEQVHKVIVELVNGVGSTSSQVLGFYGIQYIFMKDPADAGLLRTIDGIGGFTRSSATKDGVVWKVDNSHARVTYQSNLGKYFALNSTDRASTAYVPGSGVVILAEQFDKSWQLLLNGKLIKLEQNQFGQPIFKIPEAGDISLTHNGVSRRAWISLQLVIILTVIVLALPAGRKRREIPLEELV
jgi:GT2 family glycosyltransferase